MPSFKDLKVRHLQVTRSETVPVDKLTAQTTTLDKHDSGKFYTVPVTVDNLTSFTVNLPSAKVGRTVKFVLRPASYNTDVQALVSGSLISFNAEAGDVIRGTLLGLDTTTPTVSLGSTTTNTVTTVVVASAGTGCVPPLASAVVPQCGSTVEFTCCEKGTWYLSGTLLSA